MEISSFPRSQRSLTVWLPVFTFRGDHSVSPQNTLRDCINTEQHFCFPVIRSLFWNRVLFAHSLILMLVCMLVYVEKLPQINVFTAMSIFFQLGFLHDLVNGTIKLIWFSSLYKIPEKLQCLNTLTQSLVQHHHAQTWSKYRKMPYERNNTNPGLFGRSSRVAVDAIMLNKQVFAYDSA